MAALHRTLAMPAVATATAARALRELDMVAQRAARHACDTVEPRRQLDSVELTAGGVVGDRVHAIVDKNTGKIASAKHPKLWPALLACRASFVDEPRAGADAPPVLIELADGTSTRSDAPDVDAQLSRFFGRDVTLSWSGPGDYTIDEYVPDIDGVRPEATRDELIEQSSAPRSSTRAVCPPSYRRNRSSTSSR